MVCKLFELKIFYNFSRLEKSNFYLLSPYYSLLEELAWSVFNKLIIYWFNLFFEMNYSKLFLSYSKEYKNISKLRVKNRNFLSTSYLNYYVKLKSSNYFKFGNISIINST